MTSDDISMTSEEAIKIATQFRDSSWESIETNRQALGALKLIGELFRVRGVVSAYDVFEALQKKDSELSRAVSIFANSEQLQGEAANTTIDNSQIATLLHEYQDYLAAQSEDQVKGKGRKTTQEWVKEILEKQRKTPAQLAAAVAVKLAKDTTAEIPSTEQTSRALEAEKAERQKSLEVASRSGIVPIETYAEKSLAAVEAQNNVHLSETERQNIKGTIVAGILVAAIPLNSDPAGFALGEEDVDAIKRDLDAKATETGLTPAQLEKIQAREKTAERIQAAISENTGKRAPSTSAITKTLSGITNFDDLAERAQKTTLQTHELLKTHQAYYAPTLTTLSDKSLGAIAKAHNQAFPDSPISPYATYSGARTAAVVSKHDVNNQGFANSVEMHSRGLTLSEYKRAIDFAKRNPETEIGKLFRQRRQEFDEIGKHLNEINQSGFSRELQRPSMSGYSRLTNRISQYLPNRFAQPFSAITNPGGWLGQQAGKRAGSYLAGQISRSAALASVKAAILRFGAKTGLASLAVKAGLIASGIASGPVGWAITIALAGIDIANAMFKPVLDLIGAKSFGEAIRDSAIGAVILLATIPALIAGATIAIAPLSLFATVAMILFWYIPTINIAPILSTMVQLETAPSSFNQLRPEDLLPAGDVPESCPSGYPTSVRSISRGPNVASHASNYSFSLSGAGRFASQHQAVDFPTSPITASATHDGQAYYFPIGSPSVEGFGNSVIIVAECEGVTFVTAYAHLTRGLIPDGGPTAVTKGQSIGITGSTGNSTGPHLHYEIMSQGTAFDILSWLRR